MAKKGSKRKVGAGDVASNRYASHKYELIERLFPDVPKLELLGQDSPYARPSNGDFSISVSNLALRLPVHEVPGASGTPRVVKKPLPVVQPNP